MKGMELSRAFYDEYGKPMIETEFAEYKGRIATGLVGHGSECFGFDDDVSLDHDYEAGFCIWLTDEDDREFGFKLFRAYSRLPQEFMGVKCRQKSMFGADCRGVKTIKEFYSFYTGTGDLPATNRAWLALPDFYLAEATNGEVFDDPLGEFTRIREGLKAMPEDVRRKKIASCFFGMAQAGQYNYSRCIRHGETAAAAVAALEFVKSASQAAFLLSRRYAPYYKWLFRALRTLDADLCARLERIASAPANAAEDIEAVCAALLSAAVSQGLCAQPQDYLEPIAYAINDTVTDGDLRNLPIIL